MASRSEKPSEFFVDRSLGKSIVAGLRSEGLTVHSMADVYGEDKAQRLADEVWFVTFGASAHGSSLDEARTKLSSAVAVLLSAPIDLG